MQESKSTMIFFFCRHAYNISIKELTHIVVRALLEQPLSENPSLAGAQVLSVLQAVSNNLFFRISFHGRLFYLEDGKIPL